MDTLIYFKLVIMLKIRKLVFFNLIIILNTFLWKFELLSLLWKKFLLKYRKNKQFNIICESVGGGGVLRLRFFALFKFRSPVVSCYNV